MELVSNKETTVAVLPFQILTESDKLSPIITGFTEDLIINFSKFIGLSVISQYSTQNIQDLSQTQPIEQLGADYLISGSFRMLLDKIRINVQLIRFKDQKVIFAGNHDETIASILSTQDTIIQQIVSVLQQQIDYDLLSYSYKKESVELPAYENWLIGMNHLKKGSLESDKIAREHFEAALSINPKFARAYTGISLSYFNEWSCQLWDRWDVSQKGAHEYALKAIEFDENDYVSLSVLGRTYLYLEEYEKAEHFFRKSLRMNPNDADNLVQIAFSLVYLGYAEEAEQIYLKAQTLNPLHADVYFPHGSLIYLELGDYKKSAELGEKVKDISIWTDFTAFMAAVYYLMGDKKKMNSYWANYKELFKQNINKGKEATDKEAVNWQILVNPYKVKSKAEPFWEYMGGEKPKASFENNTVQEPIESSFICKGELWELSYLGETIALKDAKGYHDISKLLKEPDKEFHCSELMGAILQDNGGEDVIDNTAKKDYKKRIQELQMEIADAEEMGNTIQLDVLREEYETLIDHLSQAMGLAGKTRKVGSSVEKARTAVTWRIRSAIKKIEKAHPQLGKHLSMGIKTGTFCSYSPEIPIHWVT
ncbi:TolB-like protein [Saonia flava]|uniref:TolB-like protein n=1 Tax=Saonia flava TaxID=523696 RepID=A0A846QT66_9FLAO|nr:tetratricopeptide repeat protein [Saonia flava]NJB69712.1 TolB-like protein [Saonia flava]